MASSDAPSTFSLPLARRWVAAIVVGIGLLIYGWSLPNAFVWDDEEQIVNNAAVHSVANWPQFFAGSTFNPAGSTQLGGLYYKPLMPLTYSVLYSVAGPRAWFFRLFQLSLHITNTYLVYTIVRKLLPMAVKKQSTRQLWALGLSLVFLVHPMNVETTVYLASLQDVLFLFWGLLATFILLRQPWSTGWVYGSVGLSLLLSLLSKEAGILFVPVLALLIWWRRQDDWPWYALTTLIVGSVYAILRFGVGGVGLAKHGLSPITRMSFDERLWSVPAVAWHYLHTYLWPQRLLIAQHWVVEGPTLFGFWLPFAAILVTLAIIFSIGLHWWRTHNQWTAWWWFWSAWLVVGYVLHIQLFPLDMTVAERWFYFPQLGLLALLLAIAWHIQRTPPKQVLTWLFAIILVALGTRSIVRSLTWRDGLSLYAHDQQYVRSFDLSNNYGVELYRSGKIEEAKEQFLLSTQLAPFWWTNWNNLGAIEEQEGDLAAAEKHYRQALDNGDYYLAYINFAQVLAKQEKLAEATAFLQDEALPRYPYNPQLWELLAITAWQQNDVSRATQAIERAWQIEPTQRRQQLRQQLMTPSQEGSTQ